MKLEKGLFSKPFFNVVCLEKSDTRHVMAFVKDGQVFSNKEMCGRNIVRMAYNHEDGVFEVDEEGKVVKTGLRQSEVLISFFSSQKLTPVWKNANFTWGWFDEETGRWTGACALVRPGFVCHDKPQYPQVGYDKADLGVVGFGCSHARSTIVLCSQPLGYSVTRWISRAPRPLPPAFNLVRIFTSSSWLAVFTSLLAVTCLLLIAARVGKSYGINTFNYLDLASVPYRFDKVLHIHLP